MMNSPLYERINEIYKLISESHKRHILQQDELSRLMLYSCLDTIEETEIALESFLKSDTNDSNVGGNYLRIYGVLQGLFIQQDAVKNLHEALKIPYTIDPLLKEIREIRNNAVGHPTNRGNKEAFNFINRLPDIKGFHLMTVYRADPQFSSEYRDIDISNLIAKQSQHLVDVLNHVIENLEGEAVAHRRKFAGEKLTHTFVSTVYALEKLFDAISYEYLSQRRYVGNHVNTILGAVEKFKDGLRERGEPDDNISDLYQNLEYALHHINAYFHDKSKTHVQREDLYIFVDFANRKVSELREIAAEIDKEYSRM